MFGLLNNNKLVFRLLYLLFTILIFLVFNFSAFAASPLDVVINEIAWMGTEDYNDEWIELKNNTESDINLAHWTLNATDGTPNIALVGIIQANSFFLLERTDDTAISDIAASQIYTGALENNGEQIELHDGSGNIIDSIDGFYAGDNKNKITMERINPFSAGNISNNWGNNNGIQTNGLDKNGISINGTPFSDNSLFLSPPNKPISTSSPNEDKTAIKDISQFDIKINEVKFTDPMYDWVELYCMQCQENILSLNSFRLRGETLPEVSLKTGDFIVLNYEQEQENIGEWINTNSGRKIEINLTKGDLFSTNVILKLEWDLPGYPQADTVAWSNNNALIEEEGFSGYGINSNNIPPNISIGRDNNSSDTDTPYDWHLFHDTKGKKNILVNSPPTAVITWQGNKTNVGTVPFSINVTGASSFDPDNDPLEYSWDFNDTFLDTKKNPLEHTYTNPGTYILHLTVADPFNAVNEKTATIIVNDIRSTLPAPSNSSGGGGGVSFYIPATDYNQEIIINEVFPNPLEEKNEWIELKNLEDMPINLGNFILDDIEGGSNEHKIAENTYIPAKGFIVFYKEETEIGLNNDQDSIRLFYPNKNLADSINYKTTLEEKSFAKNKNGKFVWTSTLTPGEENIITQQKKTENKLTAANSNLATKNQQSAANKQKYYFPISYKNIFKIFCFLPAPKKENYEFITLQNISSKTASPKGWILDDKEGGTKPYKITSDVSIKPLNFFTVYNYTSGIKLNNAGDSVRLFSPDRKIQDIISYKSSKIGEIIKQDKTSKVKKPKKHRLAKQRNRKKQSKKYIRYVNILAKKDKLEGKFLSMDKFKDNSGKKWNIVLKNIKLDLPFLNKTLKTSNMEISGISKKDTFYISEIKFVPRKNIQNPKKNFLFLEIFFGLGGISISFIFLLRLNKKNYKL